MRKSLTTAVLTIAAAASAAGSAMGAPLPTGPAAVGKLTGMVLPGPDQNNASQVDNGSPAVEMHDTNLLNLFADQSRHQNTGTSGNQG